MLVEVVPGYDGTMCCVRVILYRGWLYHAKMFSEKQVTSLLIALHLRNMMSSRIGSL